MADNENTPAESGEGAGKDLNERLSFLEAEAKRAFEKRDALKEENRKLQEKLSQIDQENSEKQKDKARSSKDIEALESSWRAEISKAEQEKATLEARLKSLVLDQQVSKVAMNYLSAKGAEAFLALHKDKIDIVQDDSGALTPVFKNDVRSVEKVIQGWAEDFPGFKPNSLKSGTGSKSNTATNGKTYTKAQLLNMSRGDLDQLYKTDPQLIKDALDGKL